MGSEHPNCPKCGSDETRRVTNYGRRVGNEWQCTSCQRRWEPENELDKLRAENARLVVELERYKRLTEDNERVKTAREINRLTEALRVASILLGDRTPGIVRNALEGKGT